MPWDLDRARPFSEIWGPGGIVGYSQEGIEFDAKGKPYPGHFPHGREVKAAAKAKPIPPPKPEPPPPPTAIPPPTGFAAMDDDTLRGLIEIQGDEWTGREAAIAALEEAG